MRIAVDILSAALGGPGQYIVDLLPHLARCAATDTIHVLAAHPDLIRRLPPAENVHVHDIAAGRTALRRLWWQSRRMPAWLREHAVDVVFLPQGLTALTGGPPLVVLHQDSMFLCRERFGRPHAYVVAQQHFARRTLRRAAGALFVSKAILSLAESRGWVRPGMGKVVPYGVNVQALRAAADPQRVAALRAGPPFVLTVGSVMPHKNVLALVEAVRILRDQGRDDVRLKIAGEAPSERPYVREILARIAACRLEGTVELLGQQDRAAVSALYAAARIYASLSRLEAYGLTLVEAMAFGLPVVCSRLPAFDEVCGDIGVRVDADRTGDVAETLVALWDDASRREQLGNRGRERAAQFSWGRAAGEVYAALRDAADSASRSE